MAHTADEHDDAQSHESVSEHTALLGDSRERYTEEPAPIAIPRGNGDKYDDDDEGSSTDADPNESELRIARSFTSGASGLAPEAFESAMLRGRRRSRSTVRRASTVRSSFASLSPRPIPNGHHHHHHHQEQHADALVSNGGSEDLEAAHADVAKTYLIDTDQRRFWIVFLSIMMTHFIACFDGTIMASSHPVITSYFHSSNSASWLSTAFLLTSTAFQPIVGRLSDTIGRKPPYLAAVVIFALATLWCSLAQSMMSFILARAACGLGAGGVLGMGSIIISDLVPIE